MALKPLIAELELAKEGRRELDYAIAKEIGWRFYGEKDFKEYGLFWRDATTDEWKQLPWWTTSLDAALTLVLEGFAIENFMIWPGHPASLTILGTHKDGDKFWHNSSDGRWKGEAATPPLAVSIAALKARDHA